MMKIGRLHISMFIKNSFLFQTFMKEDAEALQKILRLEFHLTWGGSLLVNGQG